MSIYRIVSCRVHASDDFLSLSRPDPNAQTLWMYLLTCFENGPVPGVIRCGIEAIAAHHGWRNADTNALFAELEERGMVEIDRFAQLIWLPKAHVQQENQPDNRNQIIHWGKIWPLIPNCPLKLKIWETYSAWLESLSTDKKPFGELFRKTCAQPVVARYQGESRFGNRFGKGSVKKRQRVRGTVRETVDQKNTQKTKTQDPRLKTQEPRSDLILEAAAGSDASRARANEPPPPPPDDRLWLDTRNDWTEAELEPIPVLDDKERSAFYANFVIPRQKRGLTEKQIAEDARIFVPKVLASSVARQRSFHSIMSRPDEIAKIMSGDRKDWSRVERLERDSPEDVLSRPMSGGGSSLRARAAALRKLKESSRAGPVLETIEAQFKRLGPGGEK